MVFRSKLSAQDVRRHSFAVRFLKVAMPLLGVVILSTLFLWPIIQESQTQKHLAKRGQNKTVLPAAQTEAVTRGAMIAPVFTGVDTRGRPYRIEAKRVEPLGEDGARLEQAFLPSDGQKSMPMMPLRLFDLTALLTQDTANEAALQWRVAAQQGIYVPETETLATRGHVTLEQRQGDSVGGQIETEAMNIDLALRDVTMTQPVTGQWLMGDQHVATLQARALTLKGQQKQLILKGPVKLAVTELDKKD